VDEDDDIGEGLRRGKYSSPSFDCALAL